MLLFQTSIYDDVLAGASAVQYSSATIDALLGAAEVAAFQLVITPISGSPRLTAQLEHSSDGRNWTVRSVTPEINGVVPTAGVPTVYTFNDPGDRVGVGSLVRLKLSLDASGGIALIKAYGAGRVRNPGKRRGPQSMEEACCDGCEGGGKQSPKRDAPGPTGNERKPLGVCDSQHPGSPNCSGPDDCACWASYYTRKIQWLNCLKLNGTPVGDADFKNLQDAWANMKDACCKTGGCCVTDCIMNSKGFKPTWMCQAECDKDPKGNPNPKPGYGGGGPWGPWQTTVSKYF
jgi:hypothetical protein